MKRFAFAVVVVTASAAAASCTYDVLVVGGGSAGVAAALQAGRAGASTLLVERGAQVGGNMTTGGVNFPGLFHAEGRQVIDGCAYEVLTNAAAVSGLELPDFRKKPRRHWMHQIRVDIPVYVAIAEEALVRAGVELRYHTAPYSAKRQDGLWTCVLSSDGMLSSVKAKVLVDCTGDGTLAAMAGAKRMRGEETSPGSFMYTFANGRELWRTCDRAKVEEAFRIALQSGDLKREDAMAGVHRMFEGVPSTSWNYVPGADTSTAEKRTDTNMRARASMLRVLRFLRRQPGLEKVRLGTVSPEAGIRETWRVEGDYVITCDDYTSGRVFPDSLCYAYYPVDLHSAEKGVSPTPLKAGVVPTVPLRALCARGVSNLLVAGRCVSADRLAASGLRVQGACMAMGQVVGQAAAMAAKMGCDVRKVPVEELRSALSASGAIVPGVKAIPVRSSVNLLPDGGFERTATGDKTAWTPSSKSGYLLLPGQGMGGSAAVGLEDAGTNNCKWLSRPVALRSNSLYGFAAWVKTSGSNGFTMGTPRSNVTGGVPDTGGEWVERKAVIFSIDSPGGCQEVFRLGEYQANGRFIFDNARVVPLRAEYARKGGLTLGHGERVAGCRYVHDVLWMCDGRFHSRPLQAVRGVIFNRPNFDIESNGYLVYRYALTGRRWMSAEITFSAANVNGSFAVEVSLDGRSWTRLNTPAGITPAGLRVTVPAALLPAKCLHVRIAAGPKSGMRLLSYAFTGDVDGPETSFAGSTRYLEEGTGVEFARVEAKSPLMAKGGRFDLPQGTPFAAWTALSGWKVFKECPVPTESASAVRVAAAANETEAVQLVLRPTEEIPSVRVGCAGDLKSSSGASIPASAVEVFRVGYVSVLRVRDSVSHAGDWPDTLLPQDIEPTSFTPERLRKGENTPYWIRVKVPKGTPPGIYSGSLSVDCTLDVRIPFEVEVYGFELPDRMTCRTAFGFYGEPVKRYHRLKTPSDRRRVYDMYFRSLADHHASPYDPVPGIKWKVRWKNGEPDIDWREWDAAMEDARSRYGFTDFRISDIGVGHGGNSGAAAGVVPGLGIKSGHPDYERCESKYLKAVEAHLKEKGWLEDAYVYCFDEPSQRFFPLVYKGLSFIARHAPGLNRLLTSPVHESLVGGPNIWCPTAAGLNEPGIDERRKAGDRLWWYVCMFPKPPYPSLFIDHPGVDLRVWLWQGWREGVEGILIWHTTYWTSDKAYPDRKRPQNPYLDTLAWSPRLPGFGASNGDGRFFYPPPRACAAFDEGRDIGPVLDRPIESLRLEYVRDGIEDYEYFVILKSLDPENPLLKVPPEVSASPTEFSVDPVHMENHRAKLARAISAAWLGCAAK